MPTEEYKSMKERIRSAVSLETLSKLEKSITRVYNAGFFTVSEFRRLDGMLIDKRIKLEDLQCC